MPTHYTSGVGIHGERDQGQDVRTTNVTAVNSLANIVKNSLGPQGLDKMLVDEIGDVTITNDGATILRQLEVEHPAAKTIVELSQLQDKEVGDGTTSVVIIAAELLKRANELIKNKVHPTSIISGFKLAVKEACKYIDENLSVKVSELGKDALVNCARTSMSSKIIASESQLFAEMVVEAINSVKAIGVMGEIKYPVKSVNVIKCHGGSSTESKLIKGYVLRLQRASQQMPVKVENPKIACLDINLHKFKLQMGCQVIVDDPKNLEKIRMREIGVLKDRIQKIIDSGANVILTTKGIDDIASKYMVEKGIIGIRRVEKADLRRIAKSTGASLVTNMSNMESGEESFDPAWLGSAIEVTEEAIGDQDFIFIKGMKVAKSVTLVIRGANEMMVDEVERRSLESGYVVAGGGACEIALSIYLDDFSKTLVLATNAALDATDLLAKMKVLHSASQSTDDPKKRELKFTGLDLFNGKCRNNLAAGVLEPTEGKIKCLRFATEAAITILRIDDMIKLAPQKEEMPQRR